MERLTKYTEEETARCRSIENRIKNCSEKIEQLSKKIFEENLNSRINITKDAARKLAKWKEERDALYSEIEQLKEQLKTTGRPRIIGMNERFKQKNRETLCQKILYYETIISEEVSKAMAREHQADEANNETMLNPYIYNDCRLPAELTSFEANIKAYCHTNRDSWEWMKRYIK